jgi:hypothetical protein
MTDDLPPEIRARREIEDQAAVLGAQRRDLENGLAINKQRIIALLPTALAAGLPMDGFAKLVRVTRQTLYSWQGIPRR